MENPQGESVPMEGNSSQQPQQPFYNEFSQINDPKVAEDIAYVERNQGRDAALAREAALQKEYETGLTERERENLEVARMLVEEFPDAFVKSIDKNGTEMFATGLGVLQYKEVLSNLQLSLPSKGRELKNEMEVITRALWTQPSSYGIEILRDITRASEEIDISKYGISVPSYDHKDFRHYEDSIRTFSRDELKLFLEMLKFLDKVGKAKKEMATGEVGGMGVEDFRKLAQQVKNTPTS